MSMTNGCAHETLAISLYESHRAANPSTHRALQRASWLELTPTQRQLWRDSADEMLDERFRRQEVES